MSYCMFENTYNDLKDCYEALANEDELSESERKFKIKLLKLCKEIHYDFSDDQD